MKFRQIHLDFHNSEHLSDIASKFDKRQFQAALKKAHANSITLFSKCHHGWSYYDSKVNPPHPNLKNKNLLDEMIDAARDIGVRAVIYISAGYDEKALRTHREYAVVPFNGESFEEPNLDSPRFHYICLNTPYVDDLIVQVREIMYRYRPEHLFFDICAIRKCGCRYCREDMLKKGLDINSKKDIQIQAEEVYKGFCDRIISTVKSIDKKTTVFFNGGTIVKGRYDLLNFNDHLEIESLPTGGWGYDHFPISAKYAINTGKEFLEMTGKFHATWGEFGGFKHPNALMYETSLAIAHGAKCSVGDQLHPNGMMDMATYEMIGKAYELVEKKEAWCDDVSSIADIGLLSEEAVVKGNEETRENPLTNADEGASRILHEGKFLFDVIDCKMDFKKYKCLLLPDKIRIDEKLKNKIDDYLKSGGKLFLSGQSGLYVDRDEFAFDIGAKFLRESAYSPAYIRTDFDLYSLSKSEYLLRNPVYDVQLSGGRAEAYIQYPYFNRGEDGKFTSHVHTPTDKTDRGPAVVFGRDGVYIAADIFNDYANYGTITTKQLVLYALNKLLGDSKTIETNLPAQGIITYMKQGGKNRNVLHVLYASPVRRGCNFEVIEDIVKLTDLKFKIKAEKPNRVLMQPEGKELEFSYSEGKVEFVLPYVYCHQMVVLEY